MKLQFSGHDSFICKHFWLKKGYDFIEQQKRNFNDELAVVDLGVGRNMVTAVNYWLKCYGITDNANNCTELGHFLFKDKKGVDPFLENLGSLWLLHYFVIKTNKASVYNLFFNEFRRGKIEFTKEHLLNFLNRKLQINDQSNVNLNTLNADISVFIRNYLRPGSRHKKIDIEDEFSNLMIDLQLMDSYQSENADGKEIEWYKVENELRTDLPFQIIMFCILDNEQYGNSISFKELLTGINSPGCIFALSDDGLYNKLKLIESNYKGIIYAESAGIRELQIKSKPNKWEILNDYYKD